MTNVYIHMVVLRSRSVHEPRTEYDNRENSIGCDDDDNGSGDGADDGDGGSSSEDVNGDENGEVGVSGDNDVV